MISNHSNKVSAVECLTYSALGEDSVASSPNERGTVDPPISNLERHQEEHPHCKSALKIGSSTFQADLQGF